jgi:hypothetical protein
MGWTVRGLESREMKQIFSAPKRPDQLWNSPNLQFSGYWDFFQGKNGQGVKLTTTSI